MPMRPAPLAQPARKCEPILVWQTNIEQDKRRYLTLDEPPQCGAAVDGADPEILVREIAGEQLPLRRLVLNHNDMGPRVHSPSLPATCRRLRKLCREPAPLSSFPLPNRLTKFDGHRQG
jgi:hypothetical protein